MTLDRPTGGPSRRTKRRDITAEDQAAAAAFATWQKEAREARGWNIPALATQIGYSDSQVRLFDADGRAGIDEMERYRQPKREYVELVADRTEADLLAGLRAAGIERRPDVEALVVPPGHRLIEIPVEDDVVQLVVKETLRPDQLKALRLSVLSSYNALRSASSEDSRAD